MQEAHTSSNYRRTITEGAYLDQALEHKIPVLGVCHGSQISNVFRGGSLIQHVDGHFGQSTLRLLSSIPKKVADIARRVFGEKEFLTTSMHHQACDPDNLGEGLTVVLEEKGVPKALVSEDGLWMLTQFHPEEYPGYDKEQDIESNQGVFAYFVEKAHAYRAAQP